MIDPFRAWPFPVQEPTDDAWLARAYEAAKEILEQPKEEDA